MGIFRVQVHYKLGLTGKWSNVWHVVASDILSASTGFALGGVPGLLSLLHPDCVLDRLLISDPATSDFITNTINEFGTSSDSGDRLPLFNSVKVLIPTPGFGRPDMKYLKGLLTEGAQEDGVLTSGTQTMVDTNLTNMLGQLDDEGVQACSFEGDVYTNFSVQPEVQMRQMHRKRRRTAPTP